MKYEEFLPECCNWETEFASVYVKFLEDRLLMAKRKMELIST